MSEKEQLWYTRFLDFANSRLSQRRWCLEHGIPQSTFRYWISKFDFFRIDDNDGSQLPARNGQWYEISCRQEMEVTGRLHPEPADTIRLQIGDVKMEFPAGTDGRMLLQITRGLMEA